MGGAIFMYIQQIIHRQPPGAKAAESSWCGRFSQSEDDDITLIFFPISNKNIASHFLPTVDTHHDLHFGRLTSVITSPPPPPSVTCLHTLSTCHLRHSVIQLSLYSRSSALVLEM